MLPGLAGAPATSRPGARNGAAGVTRPRGITATSRPKASAAWRCWDSGSRISWRRQRQGGREQQAGERWARQLAWQRLAQLSDLAEGQQGTP